MIRLFFVVEGQTEEEFVRDVLAPHFLHFGVFVAATVVGTPPQRSSGRLQKGGGHWERWKRDICRILKEQHGADVRVTTLFDLYGLPSGFPGLEEHGPDTDTHRRCDKLEQRLADEIADWRFIPYIQRHEFETLVLASLSSLREFLDASDDLAGLDSLREKIRDQCPEDINDGKESHPSKRLESHIPGYRKKVHGPLATMATGLSQLRDCCSRFNAWVTTLESIAQKNDP